MSQKKDARDFEELLNLHRHVQGLLHREPGIENCPGVCWSPLTDVYELSDRFVIILEVPGVAMAEMNIMARDLEIVVTGNRRTAEEFGKANFHQIEREFGEFRRIFTFDRPILSDQVEAVLRQGVLTVSVRKAPASGVNSIRVL